MFLLQVLFRFWCQTNILWKAFWTSSRVLLPVCRYFHSNTVCTNHLWTKNQYIYLFFLIYDLSVPNHLCIQTPFSSVGFFLPKAFQHPIITLLSTLIWYHITHVLESFFTKNDRWLWLCQRSEGCKNYTLFEIGMDYTSGISSWISWPSLADRTIPSIIAWL